MHMCQTGHSGCPAVLLAPACCAIAVQVLHLSATVSPSQDAAFMLGIGWTTFNLVMSGFFIPYKVRQQQFTRLVLHHQC